ncbi:MAG: TIGR02996 domain-containing protein [Fimbriiglobus sp.]
MVDDQLALLRNIRAHPDDNLARLVYADWVEERGDQAMGQLIRLHIEREQSEAGSAAYFELITQAAILLAQHRDRWTEELGEQFGVTRVEFARGIPEEVELPLTSYQAVSQELFATLPIRHVIISGAKTLAEVRELNLPPDVLRSFGVAVVSRQNASRGYEQSSSTSTRHVTLLDAAPAVLEPQLRFGHWRILCVADWSQPDLAIERAYFDRISYSPEHATRRGELQLAIRRFSRHTDFETWCSIPSVYSGLHWIELLDGQLTSHRTDHTFPDHEPDSYREDDFYDSDNE